VISLGTGQQRAMPSKNQKHFRFAFSVMEDDNENVTDEK
jgi:hypothetical protein